MLIKRTDGSSYFPPNFQDMERQQLQSLSGVHYLSQDEAIPSEGEMVLITNTHTDLAKWLPYKERISCIIHPNSGHDNLNREFEKWSDIPIILGHEIRARAVCEWTLAALLQHGSFLNHQSVWPMTRAWPRTLLSERKTLLVGFGHVGFLIAHALRAQNVNVEIFDPWKGKDLNIHQGWQTVIMAASLNPSSQNFINEKFLSHLSPDALIVNGARGELIDELALRNFLKNNPQARAILDVHAKEPYPANYWNDTTQVIATAHVAGVWSGLIDSMIEFEVHTVQKWLSGETSDLPLLTERMTEQGFIR